MQVEYLAASNGAIIGSWDLYGDDDYYKCVDEEVPDNSTTFIEGTTSGWVTQYAFFHFNNPAETGRINFITVTNRTRSAWNGQTAVAIYNGSSYEAGNWVGAQGGWATQSRTWYTNPWTGVAWTFADLVDLQIGSLFVKGDGSDYANLSHTKILIDYDLIPAGQHRFIGMMM